MKKRCSHCRRYLNVDEFGKDRNRPDGRHPWCRRCTRARAAEYRKAPKAKQKQRAAQRRWLKVGGSKKQLEYQKTARGREVKWRAKIKAKHGLSAQQYDAMLKAQNNQCLACSQSFVSRRNTHVDHCHSTGKVRGLLCNHCNRALGAVFDSESILLALVDYLRRSRA